MTELGPAEVAAAFAAGLVSFLSPCVLPLVPGYLSLVAGAGSVEALAASRRRVVTATALFVAGFGAVFVLLGAGAGWFGSALLEHRRALELVGGVLVAVAGVVYAGLPLPAPLVRERRLEVARKAGGAAPAVAGVAFAVGWTPCIGPTLAAILAVAAAGGAGHAAVLLAVYSAGLGVPFLLSGLAVTHGLAVSGLVRRHRRAVSVASGAVLVAFGALIASGDLVRLTTHLARYSGLAI